MPTIIEPVGAGIIVALINKFIINNHGLWAFCSGSREDKRHEADECTSSSSTTTIDTIEVNAHF